MGNIVLPEVTLVSVTSVDLGETIRALERSCREIQFGAVKLFSPEEVKTDLIEYEWIEIDRIDLPGYNKFIIESLGSFITSNFCLIVQADGYVTNALKWENEFLEYDYIGAPWPKVVQCSDEYGNASTHEFRSNRVGNGGFSLRSRKFLEFSSSQNYADLKKDPNSYRLKAEDGLLCDYLFKDAVDAGVKFAPMDVAARFSIEVPIGFEGKNPTQTFGFHGKPWMPYVENYFNLIDFDPGIQG